MSGSFLRFGVFLLGLLGLKAVEVTKPHHAPTAPLRLRWVTNLSLGLVNGFLVSLLCAWCFVLTAQGRLPAGFALLPRLTSTLWVQIAVAVVLLDLLTYGLHRAYHRVPFLWRFHEVHHTDLDLDVSSASRFHTGEVLFSSIAKLGAVTVLGIPPLGLVVFEVVMLACSQLQHANIRLPARLEQVLWRTFVPPAMHRLHHVPNRRDADSNFGTILTLWDFGLGTFNRRAADDQPSFGIPRMRDPKALSLGSLATLPFRRPAEG
jgi:sterol desaturase/sphingolipid hydroxylase (fatty acid hydroxylase superfamily)